MASHTACGLRQQTGSFSLLRSSITSPDVSPGITASRMRASLPAMLFAASLLFLLSSPRTADRQRWTSFSCSYEPPTATTYHVTKTKRRVKKTLLLYNIWAIPTLACSCPHTTIGPRRLNCRVRYGAGCFPPRYLHPEYLLTQEYIGN